MDLDSIINVVPEKYRAKILFFIAISPYLTRGWHALSSGGGIKGFISAIWLGTNTPKDAQQKETSVPVKVLSLLVATSVLALTTSCARFHSVQTETALDGSRRETRQSITTFFDSKTEVSKVRASTTDKTQGLTVGSVSQESSGSNAVDLVSHAVSAAVSAALSAAKTP